MTPYHTEPLVTIYRGDCRVVLPQIGRFDLLLTDPPYGIDECEVAANRLRQEVLPI